VPPWSNRSIIEIGMRRKGISLTREKHRKKAPWVVRWWGRYDAATGKCRRYGRVFSRKKQAEDFIQQKLAEFEAGIPRDQVNITLEELVEKFTEVRVSKLRKKSAVYYAELFRRLKEHFGPTKPIRHIQQEDAERFISTMKVTHRFVARKKRELSDSTKNRYLRECKTLFRAAYDWHYIRQNPFAGIRCTTPIKQQWHYITPAQFRAVLKQTPNTRLKAVYSIMYGAGLRYGEAVNILWCNVDFQKNRVNLVNRPATAQLPPFFLKDREQRSVPLPQWTVDLLRQLRSEAVDGNPFVFLGMKRYKALQAKWREMLEKNEAGKWDSSMIINNLLRTFRTCCEKAGIKTNRRLNLHCLRKAYGTNLANVSTPVQTLKALMGHSSIKTTMEFYLCSCDSNEKKAVAELDRIMQEPAAEQGGSME